MDKIQGVQKSVPCLPNDYEVPEVWEPPKSTDGTFGSINRPTAGARTDEDLPRGKHALQLYSLGTANGKKVNPLLFTDFKLLLTTIDIICNAYKVCFIIVFRLPFFSKN